MASTDTKPTSVLELDSREQTGLIVKLLWDPKVRKKSERVSIEAEWNGTPYRVVVPPAEALEAFRHPFAYLPKTVEPRQGDPDEQQTAE